jgi:hypothetical protein
MRGNLFVFLALLAFIAPGALSQDVSGNVEGFVLDADGAPIGGAKVVISGSSLQGTRESATDERGRFSVQLLPVGTYTLKIVHPEYQEKSYQDVSVRLGRTTALGEIRLQLRVSEAREIVVSAERPIVDSSSAAGGVNLGAKAIEALPVDRNYRNISLLLPNANQSFLGDEGVNFSGATGLENKYFIDGIEVTNPSTGYTGANLPFNFVKEFEIRTGGYEAEYRSSLGGIVNVITYSGGNRFSGQAFGYYANNRFSGEPRLGELPSSKGDYSQYDLGLSLGGPLVRDRLWFFIAYDPTFQREDFMIPGLGFYPDKTMTHIFAGKLTWQASPRTSLVFTTLGDPSSREAVGDFLTYHTLPKSVLNPDPYLGKIEKGGTSFSLKGTQVFNNNFFIEATISQLSNKDSNVAATERGWNEVNFTDAENGILSGGYNSSAEYRSVVRTLGIKGTFRLANHIIKSGFEYRDNRLDLNWVSHNLTRFSESYYEDVVVTIEGTVHNRIPSLFAQDSWDLSRRLRINIGFRWDGQFFVATNGKLAQRILGQYQPRFGILFEPGTLGTQKIFGSFGRFYQELSLFAPSQIFNDDWTWQFTDYDHDPRIDPSGGTSFKVVPGIQPENKDMEGQSYDEFTLGYERLLGRSFKIGVRGIYRTLRHAVEDSLDQETGQYFWGNPGFGRLRNYPRPRREYGALELSAEKHGGKNLNFFASYVLSKNYGNYPGLYQLGWGIAPNGTNQFDYPELLVNATGLLPNDRTHVFKFFGFYRWPFGLVIGTSIIWQSGTPLSELGGSSFGGLWNEFIGQRGTAGRTPSIFDLNLRIVYDLSRIMNTKWTQKIVLDAFHLGSQQTPVALDQVHYFGIDETGAQTAPNPNYGQATRYFPATSVRLGFEIGF